MTANPYLNRTMIKDPAAFYGRRRELNKLFARLGNPRPQSVAVVGERRMGKSSLLYQVYHPANRRARIQDAGNLVCVFIDLSERKDYQIGQVFQEIFRRIGEETGQPITADSGTGYDTFKAVAQELEATGRRLVILFDEFEAIASNPNIASATVTEFLAFLRGIANSQAVAYVTSSQTDLQEVGHSGEIKESPFFNIFTRISLGPLEADEALALIGQPSAAAGRPLASYADTLLSWAGTYPYFLQIACSTIFEAIDEGSSAGIDLARARADFIDETEDQFDYVWTHLNTAEQAVLQQLAAGQVLPPEQAWIARGLERSGYVVSVQGRPQVFSGVFAERLSELAQRAAARAPETILPATLPRDLEMRLRAVLVDLYPDEAGARRVTADAGVDGSHIAFSAVAANNWQAILQEAGKQNRIGSIVEVARRDYTDNTALERIARDYDRWRLNT